MNRRDFILFTTASAFGLTSVKTVHASNQIKQKMGISVASYGARWRQGDPQSGLGRFEDALDLIRHAHKLGAGGVQTGVRDWTLDFARRIRDFSEQNGLFVEGQIRTARDYKELVGFEHQIRIAKEAGVRVFRTVMLGGRRYETFKTLEEWKDFVVTAKRSLERVAPVLEKLKVKLAIENHKDWRVEEMWDLLSAAPSPNIGINLDLGNSISLLEDPMKVIEAYAPLTFTTHFKDMAMREYEDGFLLSEVPLGEGVLDLKMACDVLVKANPNIRHNLEMITRDPLKVPCLNEDYWVTMDEIKGRELADCLSLVRCTQNDKVLPRVNGLAQEEQVRFEEENVMKCFEYAGRVLGI